MPSAPAPAPLCALEGCRSAAEPGAPVALCTAHLGIAHDWVAREDGVVDAWAR